MNRLAIPLLFGLVGVAILLALGLWQVQRLAWKQEILSDIETRIAADPVPLPADPDPTRDAYLPVTATGTATPAARVLASVKLQGAGYRLIDVFETGGRKVLLDRGFIRQQDATHARDPREVTVTGNLHWPRERDGFTPDPDVGAGLWFARDVPAMAAALGTEPVLIVARSLDPPGPGTPLPIGTGNIPNNHLQYAMTWFSLAAIWAGMTVLWVWRITRGEGPDRRRAS